MKSCFVCSLIASATIGVVCQTESAQASTISPGDVIAVDFASAGGSATNFNVINAAPATISSGNVIRWNGGSTIDNVSLSFSRTLASGGTPSSAFIDEPNAAYTSWAGYPNDPYYSLAADDLVYATSGTDTNNVLTLTFAGLNNALSYNVRIYSLISTSGTRVDNFLVTNGAGTVGGNSTRGTRWSASTLQAGGTVYTGLATNGSGSIVVTATSSFADGNNIFLNAVVLQAVPEPSGFLLVATGFSGIAAASRRARRAN